MASAPVFFATPTIDSGVVPATNDTSLTAPTHVTVIATGTTGGKQINELTFVGLGTTVAGRVNVFLFDGSTYHLYDQVMVTAAIPSTTLEVWRQTNEYPNLILPSSSWTLVVSVMDSSNESLINVVALSGAA